MQKKHLKEANIRYDKETPLNRVGIEEIHLNIIKAIYDKPTGINTQHKT